MEMQAAVLEDTVDSHDFVAEEAIRVDTVDVPEPTGEEVRAGARFSQRFDRPMRQYSHFPQAIRPRTTVSPGSTSVTSGPTSRTTPAPS